MLTKTQVIRYNLSNEEIINLLNNFFKNEQI